MADLALVFHWQPDYLDTLTLPDLMAWRERARIRNGGDD
ncbi:GpE family phage tail protein [Silvimonas sp.]|nr:GpE family phage tail protein [Silvimonas sp.]MDR3429011.1 GpE family phage tail protein [Silvimonas sp.]